MIQNLKTQFTNNKQVQELCKKTGIKPDSIIGGIFVVLALLLNRTFIGHTFTNMVCLFFPLQDTMSILKSPSPNVKDMRRNMIVLMTFCLIVVVEPLLKSRVPLYSGAKIALVYFVTFKAGAQKFIQDNLIDNFPCCGSSCTDSSKATIENATGKATEVASKAKEVAKETLKDK